MLVAIVREAVFWAIIDLVNFKPNIFFSELAESVEALLNLWLLCDFIVSTFSLDSFKHFVIVIIILFIISWWDNWRGWSCWVCWRNCISVWWNCASVSRFALISCLRWVCVGFSHDAQSSSGSAFGREFSWLDQRGLLWLGALKWVLWKTFALATTLWQSNSTSSTQLWNNYVFALKTDAVLSEDDVLSEPQIKCNSWAFLNGLSLC